MTPSYSTEITNNHFLIAGTEKAGTTSVFSYLSAHPAVCASTKKETDFFRCKGRLEYSDYLKYFAKCPHQPEIFTEASPGYLSEAEHVSIKLSEILPHANLLFILRNPIDRFVSNYRFHVGRLNIHKDITFDEYVEKCFAYHQEQANLRELGLGEWYLKSLSQGLYGEKLSHFIKRFPKNQIKIMFFDDLVKDSKNFMIQLCSFLNIDERFYNSFMFHRENVTFSGKNKILHKLAISFNNSSEPFLRKHPSAKRVLLSLYKLVNAAPPNKEKINERVIQRLEKFYLNDKDLLIRHIDDNHWKSISWLQK